MMDDGMMARHACVFIFSIAMTNDHRICLYLILKHVEEFALDIQFPYYLIRLGNKIDFIGDFRIFTPLATF